MVEKCEDIALLKDSNKTCSRKTSKFCFDYLILQMEYNCRGNCGKSFASISSRNKHGRKKEHFNEKKSNHEINFDKESNYIYVVPLVVKQHLNTDITL